MKKQIIIIIIALLLFPLVNAQIRYSLNTTDNQLIINSTGEYLDSQILITPEGTYVNGTYISKDVFVSGLNTTKLSWFNASDSANRGWIKWATYWWGCDSVSFMSDFNECFTDNQALNWQVFKSPRDYSSGVFDNITSWTSGLMIQRLTDYPIYMMYNTSDCISGNNITCPYVKLNNKGWNQVSLMTNVTTNLTNITIPVSSAVQNDTEYTGGVWNYIAYQGIEDYNLSNIMLSNATYSCKYNDCLSQGTMNLLNYYNMSSSTYDGVFNILRTGNAFLLYLNDSKLSIGYNKYNITFLNIHAVPLKVQFNASKMIFTNSTPSISNVSDIRLSSTNNNTLSSFVKLYYDFEPLAINHTMHNGTFDRQYSKSEWNWTPLCEINSSVGSNLCNGGYVTMLVNNIDYGPGSNLFTPSTANPGPVPNGGTRIGTNNGGSLPISMCNNLWSCADWSICKSSSQRRTCIDLSGCPARNIPLLLQSCNINSDVQERLPYYLQNSCISLIILDTVIGKWERAAGVTFSQLDSALNKFKKHTQC